MRRKFREAGRRTFRAISVRNYRLFFTGQVISVSGTWMQSVAQAYLILFVLHGTGMDVAIDGIPAGVAQRARKPMAVDAGLRIKHLLRRLDPVDLARRLAPKTVRIGKRTPVDLVVAAGAHVHGVLLWLVDPILRRFARFASRQVGAARPADGPSWARSTAD